MTTATDKYPEGWQDAIEILIAVWLIVSPFVLAFSDISNATLTAELIGTAVFAMSQFSAANQKPWEEWFNLILAVFLAVSPFVLGYAGSAIATWNAIISGALIGAFAIASMSHEYVQLKMHHTTMG
jgi:hypothetical protein